MWQFTLYIEWLFPCASFFKILVSLNPFENRTQMAESEIIFVFPPRSVVDCVLCVSYTLPANSINWADFTKSADEIRCQVTTKKETFKPSESHSERYISNLSPTEKVSEHRIALLLLVGFTCTTFSLADVQLDLIHCFHPTNRQTIFIRSLQQITTLHHDKYFSLSIFPLHFADIEERERDSVLMVAARFSRHSSWLNFSFR